MFNEFITFLESSQYSLIGAIVVLGVALSFSSVVGQMNTKDEHYHRLTRDYNNLLARHEKINIAVSEIRNVAADVFRLESELKSALETNSALKSVNEELSKRIYPESTNVDVYKTANGKIHLDGKCNSSGTSIVIEMSKKLYDNLNVKHFCAKCCDQEPVNSPVYASMTTKRYMTKTGNTLHGSVDCQHIAKCDVETHMIPRDVLEYYSNMECKNCC